MNSSPRTSASTLETQLQTFYHLRIDHVTQADLVLKLIEQFKEVLVGKPKSLEEFWEDHVKLTLAHR